MAASRRVTMTILWDRFRYRGVANGAVIWKYPKTRARVEDAEELRYLLPECDIFEDLTCIWVIGIQAAKAYRAQEIFELPKLAAKKVSETVAKALDDVEDNVLGD